MYLLDHCNRCKWQFRKNKLCSDIYEGYFDLSFIYSNTCTLQNSMSRISQLNVTWNESLILMRSRRTDAYKMKCCTGELYIFN
jgi:hypothetical protein